MEKKRIVLYRPSHPKKIARLKRPWECSCRMIITWRILLPLLHGRVRPCKRYHFLKAGGRGKGNSFQSMAISHDASKDGGGKSPSPSKEKGDTFLFFQEFVKTRVVSFLSEQIMEQADSKAKVFEASSGAFF